MGKKYEWAAVLRYHLEGHTLAECRKKFGYAKDAWYKAVARGAIMAPPPQNSGGTRRYDWSDVQRYYDEGHSYQECRMRLGFAVERVIREAKSRTHLNRLENLRMLCPNCHSQTETFASRNRRKLRIIPG